MRKRFLLLAALLLTACGVPPQAGQLARQQAVVLAAASTDDAAVQAALLAQADAWNNLSALVRRHDFPGITVDADFIALVDQTAALARRQRDLIQQHADDPAASRAALAQMHQLWQQVQKYLGQ